MRRPQPRPLVSSSTRPFAPPREPLPAPRPRSPAVPRAGPFAVRSGLSPSAERRSRDRRLGGTGPPRSVPFQHLPAPPAAEHQERGAGLGPGGGGARRSPLPPSARSSPGGKLPGGAAPRRPRRRAATAPGRCPSGRRRRGPARLDCVPRSCRDVTRGPAAHRTPGPARPGPPRSGGSDRPRGAGPSRERNQSGAPCRPVPSRPDPYASVSARQSPKRKQTNRRAAVTPRAAGAAHAPARARPCSGPPCIAPLCQFCRIGREPNPTKDNTTKLGPPVKRTQSRPADTFSPRAPYGTASAAMPGKINGTRCFPGDTESRSL